MQTDTFEIAYNKESLEYYSYLREVLETPHISYWMGNPSVNITNGIIYFPNFSDILQTSNLENQSEYMHEYKNIMIQRAICSQKPFSRVLLLLGILSSKSPVEVLERFQSYLKWIQEVIVLKTSHFKYYGMLILFQSEQLSLEFYKELLGEEYNGLDMEKILLRQIQEITIQCTGLQTESDKIYHNTLKKQQNCEKVSPLNIFLKNTQGNNGRKSSFNESPMKTNKFFLPQKQKSPNKKVEQSEMKSDELSTCTICFEQTEETQISILCEHYFHIKCLSRWKEETCPLCRYHQQPPLISFCEKCNLCEGLWICLICGIKMCCGSSHDILGSDSHIYEHYLETQHRLSMNVETKFIFDASQASFLHKMFYQQLKNKEGQLNLEDKSSKKNKKDKVSQKISQFEQNISEEMQIQRVYFEQNINKQLKNRKQAIKQKRKKIIEIQTQIEKFDWQSEELEQSIKNNKEKNQKLQKQLKVITDVQNFWKKKSEENQKNVKKEQQKVQEQLTKLNILINSKKQQLKDYKTNIKLQNKLKSNIGDDKVEAQVYLGGENKKKKK